MLQETMCQLRHCVTGNTHCVTGDTHCHWRHMLSHWRHTLCHRRQCVNGETLFHWRQTVSLETRYISIACIAYLNISARVACYVSGSTCITIHVKLPSPSRIHSHRIDIIICCSTGPCSSFRNYLNIARDPIPGCQIPFLSDVTRTR